MLIYKIADFMYIVERGGFTRYISERFLNQGNRDHAIINVFCFQRIRGLYSIRRAVSYMKYMSGNFEISSPDLIIGVW